MPTIQENRDTWNVYDWIREAGEEWSTAWGGTDLLWHVTLLPRLHGFLPARTVLEIAPGGGRITTHLVARCERMHLVDISPTAIEACRERFREQRHVAYHLNDGRSLASIEDDSVDLAFSWDSLVHAERDALEGYVADLARKLVPGGVALLHHSNLAACRLPGNAFAADMDQPANGWRATGVSADLVRELCVANRLACPVQEVFEWSRRGVASDCLSLIVRSGANGAEATRLIRTDMQGEMAAAHRLFDVYGSHWRMHQPVTSVSHWWSTLRQRLRRGASRT